MWLLSNGLGLQKGLASPILCLLFRKRMGSYGVGYAQAGWGLMVWVNHGGYLVFAMQRVGLANSA